MLLLCVFGNDGNCDLLFFYKLDDDKRTRKFGRWYLELFKDR